MPRNSSGTMTGANGPYIVGTVADPTLVNARFADEETEITDSLSRSGKGGMTAPLRTPDGTVAAPGHAFTSEPASGLYKAGTGDVRVAVGGVDALKLIAGGLDGLNLKGSSVVAATAADAQLQLQGNRVAASASPDVAVVPSVTRTAGIILQVYNNGARLNVDYQGLLQLAAQAAAIQPASIATAVTPGTNIAATGASYWKDATGTVHVQGFVSGSGATIVNGTVLFNLPAGFRPADPRQFVTIDSSRNLFGVQVAINGDVTLIAPVVVNTSGTSSIPNSGPVLFLDVIQFLART
jgi:hypothetical protein